MALLNDIKPIMDALEDVMAKMSDSIYVNVIILCLWLLDSV